MKTFFKKINQISVYDLIMTFSPIALWESQRKRKNRKVIMDLYGIALGSIIVRIRHSRKNIQLLLAAGLKERAHQNVSLEYVEESLFSNIDKS